MTVQTNGFIYDGKTSDDFGLIVCKIDGSNASDTSGGEIEITKVESPIQNRWIKSGNSNYTGALQFGFQVCKSNFQREAYRPLSIGNEIIKGFCRVMDFSLTHRLKKFLDDLYL